ncbi:lysylphosphatidylglycerol synthase transmembrane domain-containing protein [Pararhizobium haloflavum]|uniref:lysylphosphatidylglycerol synthase transmembrane domain-containing protein n=1 Tax=Pararhizobium haloflavum TaxID=2037914 RepID=UPI001FE1A56C|nr:lysylphosphatidylglycerol synthase transmembrane domain-containing protein [Pararhizobium haloflavum]
MSDHKRMRIRQPWSMMPERHGNVIRVLCVIGLLVAIMIVVDFGDALESLLNADPLLIFVALLLVQGQIVLSALRWRFTAMRLGQPIGTRTAIGEYYLASLLNLVLPGGVGGDVLRAYRMTAQDAGGSSGRDAPATVRAVMLERLAGQAAFCLIAAAGAFAWPLLLTGSRPEGTLTLLALPLLAVAIVAAAAWAVLRFGPEPARRFVADTGPDIIRAWFRQGAWLVQGVLSIVIALLYIAVFAIASAAVGAPLSWPAWITLVPLVLLTMLIPISVGGFGIREGAAAALWPLAGHAGSYGLAAALLYALLSIAGAAPGLLLVWKRRR